MNKEISEVIEYLRENYKGDYNEILGIIKRVYDKIKEDGKRCFDESDYDKAKELIEWSKKFEMLDFSGAVIATENDYKNKIKAREEICASNDNETLLSLSDVWTSYIPIRFTFGDKNEIIFSNWKNVYTGILKELYRRDCKTFEEMVVENKVSSRQSQKQLFAQRKISDEYVQIPGIGYFYKSYGLSPEQMRLNLQKIFDCFKIEWNELKIFVNSKRKRKSKGNNTNNEDVNDEVVYLMDKSRRCPVCSTILESTSKSYLIYDDESKAGDPRTEHTYIKRCDKCDKDFITKDTFLTLQKQKNNFEKRIGFIVSRQLP